ncbi:hypothetical protein [Aerosakkonema sp. BLCC-F183]|uniref:hypothetical protein n=1 Tax=Aerosakkonema sp. BLCC-F183 TaxID=3342834 RepID=UPI0035BC4F58
MHFLLEPSILSFQGALPVGDWVFIQVEYPILLDIEINTKLIKAVLEVPVRSPNFWPIHYQFLPLSFAKSAEMLIGEA